MGEEKEKVRKSMLEMRKGHPEEERDWKSDRVMERFFDLEEYRGAEVVALYLSRKDEVDAWKLVEAAAEKKSVVLPIVKGRGISFVYYEKHGRMRRGPYGIMEPVGSEFSGKIDLMAMPGVAFDREGNRLGMGKGYYDKYLAGAEKPGALVGLCFDFQVLEGLPKESFDVPVGIIVTDRRTIRVRG